MLKAYTRTCGPRHANCALFCVNVIAEVMSNTSQNTYQNVPEVHIRESVATELNGCSGLKEVYYAFCILK